MLPGFPLCMNGKIFPTAEKIQPPIRVRGCISVTYGEAEIIKRVIISHGLSSDEDRLVSRVPVFFVNYRSVGLWKKQK